MSGLVNSFAKVIASKLAPSARNDFVAALLFMLWLLATQYFLVAQLTRNIPFFTLMLSMLTHLNLHANNLAIRTGCQIMEAATVSELPLDSFLAILL
jgi:hypothetical protein